MSKSSNIYKGLHTLNNLVFTVNKPFIGKKGTHYNKLLKDWKDIVGKDISRYAIPTKISASRLKGKIENVLYVATNNAAAAAELVYHAGVLKEQINFYFGYEYIQKIKFVQAVFQVSSNREIQTKKLSPEQALKLEDLVMEYKQDDKIREILVEMGTAILQK